jgi:tungstate transport system substrate-binding protein
MFIALLRRHAVLVILLCWTAVNVPVALARESIKLAITTSTYHSGLMDVLLTEFGKIDDLAVQLIAVGSGKALTMASNGDVDMVMTHAPAAEARFVNQGYGIDPRKIMYNDFIIVGPAADPAAIGGLGDALQALQRIDNTSQRFISRGDDSGTHKKELGLWQALGKTPAYTGYLETGRGMGHTLQMAAELAGYTMTDRGTWLAIADNLPLRLLVEGDTRLRNPYQIILVNPARHPHVRIAAARRFRDWLVSTAGQTAIGDFQISDQVLFHPAVES